jgi:dTDP-4-amino-4,6-dideoxygalactose transaminase
MSESEQIQQPDLSEYIIAQQELKEINEKRKELISILKRKADEVEDFLLNSDKKKIRIENVECELKSKEFTPWSEKSIREFVDEDGKLDVDMYKSKATVVKQKLVLKVRK